MNRKKIKNRVKKLKFSEIVRDLREYFSKIPDDRKLPDYPIEDIIISVFAMMFFQDPSLLAFQKRMEDVHHSNNLKQVFKVKKIPSDGTIRNILDEIDSRILLETNLIFIKHLQRSKLLKQFQYIDGYYLIVLDGTQYFTSYKCSCDKCLTTKTQKGIRYHHNVIQATLVDPSQKIVLPLLSEEIVNDPDSDKYNKQDSEHKAAKRLLINLKKAFPRLKIIIQGDDLYSHEPIIKLLKKLKMSFLFTAKKTSHIKMFEYMEDDLDSFESRTYNNTKNISKKTMLNRLKSINSEKGLDEFEKVGRFYQQTNISDYKYYTESVPVNGQNKTKVNYFELKTYDELTNKIIFQNSWITDLDVDSFNIKKFVKAGRGRWRIEKQFLTLKKGGYNLEHNYGHGKKNLSFNFYILNTLAFLIHQVLYIVNKGFSELKTIKGSFNLFHDFLKMVIQFFLFDSLDDILLFGLNQKRVT